MRSIRDAGFTLVELIVVTLIIGILAAIAVPVFLTTVDQARASALQAAMANARLAISLVVVDDRELPTGAARDDILSAHGDSEITLALSGSGTVFCVSGTHVRLADEWASSERVAPTRNASCAAGGAIILP